jgi:hypothetical protein
MQFVSVNLIKIAGVVLTTIGLSIVVKPLLQCYQILRKLKGFRLTTDLHILSP